MQVVATAHLLESGGPLVEGPRGRLCQLRAGWGSRADEPQHRVLEGGAERPHKLLHMGSLLLLMPLGASQVAGERGGEPACLRVAELVSDLRMHRRKVTATAREMNNAQAYL